jgi:hypothetical protein
VPDEREHSGLIDDLFCDAIQNGKQGEIQNLAEANAQAAVESAATGGTH